MMCACVYVCVCVREREREKGNWLFRLYDVNDSHIPIYIMLSRLRWRNKHNALWCGSVMIDSKSDNTVCLQCLPLIIGVDSSTDVHVCMDVYALHSCSTGTEQLITHCCCCCCCLTLSRLYRHSSCFFYIPFVSLFTLPLFSYLSPKKIFAYVILASITEHYTDPPRLNNHLATSNSCTHTGRCWHLV